MLPPWQLLGMVATTSYNQLHVILFLAYQDMFDYNTNRTMKDRDKMIEEKRELFMVLKFKWYRKNYILPFKLLGHFEFNLKFFKNCNASRQSFKKNFNEDGFNHPKILWATPKWSNCGWQGPSGVADHPKGPSPSGWLAHPQMTGLGVSCRKDLIWNSNDLIWVDK